MYQEKLTKVLLAPCIGEKAAILAEYGQYVFKVRSWASKPEIAAAITQMFNVAVQKVRTSQMPGKVCRFKHRLGKRSDWKKAYVTLQAGQVLNLTEEV